MQITVFTSTDAADLYREFAIGNEEMLIEELYEKVDHWADYSQVCFAFMELASLMPGAWILTETANGTAIRKS
jgi:hypothetical protein